MRYLTLMLLPLCVLLFDTAAKADGGAPATQPVVTAAARREAFFHQNIIEAYEKVGRRNPKWDADARKVVALAERCWTSRRDAPDPDLEWQIMFFADRAFRAGCDDPLILYHGLRAHEATKKDFDHELLKRLDRTVHDCKYASFLKVAALQRLADYAASMTAAANVAQLRTQLIQDAIDNLPGMMSEADFPRDKIADICSDLTDDGREGKQDRRPTIDKIYNAMIAAQPQAAVADLFKGIAYCTYAWDARGGSFAADVTENGWRLFAQRLAVAKEACDAALDKDPYLSDAAAQMLCVQLGEDEDRQKMEQYFQVAIAGDPDLYQAYDKKLYYLTPKWHGTVEDQIAFGRECLATGRWDARIPFLLLQSHKNIVENRFREICTDTDSEAACAEAWQQALSELYKAQPGTWQDVQRLYEGYLAYNPAAVTDRINYALSATLAGQLDLAVTQLRQVCTNTDPAFKPAIWRDGPGSVVITALFARALRRQGSGELKEALVDLQDLCKVSLPANSQQPYWHLWIWMTRVQLGERAQANQELQEFVKAYKPIRPNNWPPKIAAFFLGQLSEADLLATAAASPASARTGNQCEAWFYAGKMRLLAGDTQKAADYFKKCIATNQTEFAEYLAAKVELKTLGQ